MGAGPLRPVAPGKRTSNPASSSLAVSSSASSGDSLRTSTFHLSEESGTGRATTAVNCRIWSTIRSASSRGSDRPSSRSNARSFTGRDAESIRDSTRTRVVSSGRDWEPNSEALSSRAVVEIVAARDPVESAIRITGSLESWIVLFDSLAFLMIES